MRIGRISSKGAIVDFPGGGQNPGGATLVKFHFTNSKLAEKHFSTKRLRGKYRISKFRGGPRLPLAPLFRCPCLAVNKYN